MWYCPNKYIKPVERVNEELLKLKGNLEDREARISLAKFLKANIALTVELLTGKKLFPYQVVMLKGMMNRNFSLMILGRGCSKSWTAAVFCFLQCIFEPGSKILIAGPTFRTGRNIFKELKKMVEGPGGTMLAQCFEKKPEQRADLIEWDINGGSIKVIPLNGEKIRGFRANILLLDEFLLLTEDMVKTVLMPFLVANKDVEDQVSVNEFEDVEVAAGRMKEEERTKFVNVTKMVAMSSASFTFENLYQTYKEWTEKIMDENANLEATYFIFQMSYEMAPKELISKTIIEEAKNGGNSHSSFLREYCARFIDGSDSYFSAVKMEQCTIPAGQEPHLRLTAEKGKKYVISVDPNFSNSKAADNFAMGVMELDMEGKDSALVHNYAVAGGDLKNHIRYFFYLYSVFKPELVIVDSADFRFIESCNNSPEFLGAGIELKFFEFQSDKEGAEYTLELEQAKRKYNKEFKIHCLKQDFTSNSIRFMNSHLQACIDHKKIWFASKISSDDSYFNKCTDITNQLGVPLKLTQFNDLGDLVDEQDELIHMVKKECSLIEVTTTAKGNQSFDLPQHLKRSDSVNRARKDSYTALMLGAWGTKIYFDLISTPSKSVIMNFIPRGVR